jgi:hypothetical protein
MISIQWHMAMHSKMTMLLPCWTHVRVLVLHSSERTPTPDLDVRYCDVIEQSKPHWSWANFAFTGGRQALRAFKQIDGEDQPESSCEKATTSQDNPCVTGSYTGRPSFEPHQSMYDQA